ncbi:MAG: DUF4149 domain-containing protein [Pseudomonadota bacterium]
MDQIALLSTAILLGGMTFFSFGYAPVLFKLLGVEDVRPILRGTFPYYYAVIIVLSAVSAAITLWVEITPALLLAAICASTIYARQILMLQINAATDRGDKAAFGRLHGVSVIIQLIQLGLCAWALLLI